MTKDKSATAKKKKVREHKPGDFVVIEAGSLTAESTAFDQQQGINVYGPFRTLKKARKFVSNDAFNTFTCSGNIVREGADETWAGPAYICQIVQALRPVPVVGVTIKLKDIS